MPNFLHEIVVEYLGNTDLNLDCENEILSLEASLLHLFKFWDDEGRFSDFALL